MTSMQSVSPGKGLIIQARLTSVIRTRKSVSTCGCKTQKIRRNVNTIQDMTWDIRIMPPAKTTLLTLTFAGGFSTYASPSQKNSDRAFLSRMPRHPTCMELLKLGSLTFGIIGVLFPGKLAASRA